ncbi:spliceosome-associated protein CWC15 [Biomphalaria glabrata]|uniref:Spliceosome-associated protein CWC15 homolog n=2 Tax=Biomphalaria TaxID=6525 RepID=A0A2C9JF68_BIOGL|nr:putative spliceosome-associated protein CWC15 [Biomphalaria glabrata]KAI8772489.1 spliceosome-associated protein CWC15 [Biomphalaria glabrata]KAK0066406.1 spliceosome-associated protein CWC15 [Biomphalaria pfeifferi]
MTTAARPTWDTAKGGRGKGEGDLSVLSKQYSSRDLPSHTKSKYRQEGQGTQEELRNRDFRRELEERERSNREKRGDRNRESGSSSSSKRPRIEQIPAANLDADDPVDDEDEEDATDDEDDTAELLAELQRIKKERIEEKAKMEAERKAEEERIRTENILMGNPLMQPEKQASTDFKVKRRWDDDVVFKNCAKGNDTKTSRGFINDTLRSEFHKKFMEKYVK